MSTGFRRKVVTNSTVIKHSLNLIGHQSHDIQEMQQHIYLYVQSFFHSLVYSLGIHRTDTGPLPPTHGLNTRSALTVYTERCAAINSETHLALSITQKWHFLSFFRLLTWHSENSLRNLSCAAPVFCGLYLSQTFVGKQEAVLCREKVGKILRVYGVIECFGGHTSFYGATDTPVLDFWLVTSPPVFKARVGSLFALGRGIHDVFLRLTSGATPANLLLASMAASHCSHAWFSTCRMPDFQKRPPA